jgi:trk/ktr system potassium uptake protein
LKKRLKIPHVVARAIDQIHKEILLLTGADEVILPEQEIGFRLASSLSLPFTELSCISKSFSISQITTPAAFVGKTVASLDFFTTYHATCIGIRKDDDIQAIDNNYIIQSEDKLIFAGNNKGLGRLAQLSL